MAKTPTMGLGKLKGVMNGKERRSRLDAEMDRQEGGGRKPNGRIQSMKTSVIKKKPK